MLVRSTLTFALCCLIEAIIIIFIIMLLIAEQSTDHSCLLILPNQKLVYFISKKRLERKNMTEEKHVSVSMGLPAAIVDLVNKKPCV